MLLVRERELQFQVSMTQPETYVMTIQCGDDCSAQGFKAFNDADARITATDILGWERRRIARAAVIGLMRLDGTPVVSPRLRG